MVEDREHYDALGVAIEMVAAQRDGKDLTSIMVPFVNDAATAEARDTRTGLVCQYLTKLASQLADMFDEIAPGTAERWIEGTRSIAQGGLDT